jgi:hypothetical protein
VRGLSRFLNGTDSDDEKVDVREVYRTQLVASIGGWQGMLVAGLPAVVFVIVNATAGLRPGIIAAISTGVALTAYRLVRKQSVQQALSGLFGVLIAALIAARTGQARGYFLFGIWQSFVYAVPFVLSVLVRRPLVGLAYEFLDPTPGEDATPWHRRRGLLVAYTIATLIGAALFLARGFVQLALYGDNATGWLAFARIAMGYPLFVLAFGAAWWVVRRARAQAVPLELDEPTQDAPAVPSADDSGLERGLGLG